MILNTLPIATIKSAWLADSVRCTKSRVMGAFASIRNLIPGLSDGIGRVRTGYSTYDSNNQGITAPAGVQIAKIASIQNPESLDEHIFFCSDSGQKIYLSHFWRGATKVTGNTLINLNYPFTKGSSSWNILDKTITIDSAGQASGLSDCLTNDFFNGWLIHNSSQNEYNIVTDFSYNGGSDQAIFTFLYDVDGDGLGWLDSNSYVAYRGFHDNPTFSPAYNNDLANPPVVNVENSIIRLSGGQSSTTGNRGVIIFPYLKRTFFPGVSGGYSFEGTYISERELKTVSKANLVLSGKCTDSGGWTNGLQVNHTYWIGIAPIYDGYQLGPLTKFETPSSDYTWSDTANWGSGPSNYLKSSADTDVGITIPFKIHVGILNKRITGFAVFMAQDDGDTTASGRVNPYYYIGKASIVDSTVGWGTTWAWTAGYYTMSFNIEGDAWNNRGDNYDVASGYSENVPDTMYSYSTESIVGTRRVLANCYITSETSIDRSNVFTNPMGGSIGVGNSGMIQPDIFPNQEQIYRFRIEPTVGTQVNSIVPVGVSQFLVIKNRGMVLCQFNLVDDLPVIDMRIESSEIGCSTVNAWAKDDMGGIYFPSYQDIYRYSDGLCQKLIERENAQDWLATYRESISTTEKENANVFYLQELKTIVFLFGNNRSTSTGYNSMQYMYFPEYATWREIRYAESGNPYLSGISFKWATKLSNGHTIGTTTESSPTTKRLSWIYSAGAYIFTYVDGSTSIKPYLDTGNMVIKDESTDIILSKVVINKTIDSATSNTLACSVYVDSTQTQYTAQDKTKTRLELMTKPTSKRIGQQIRVTYNDGAMDMETLNAGKIFQINSIEIHGKEVPRLKRLTD